MRPEFPLAISLLMASACTSVGGPSSLRRTDIADAAAPIGGGGAGGTSGATHAVVGGEYWMPPPAAGGISGAGGILIDAGAVDAAVDHSEDAREEPPPEGCDQMVCDTFHFIGFAGNCLPAFDTACWAGKVAATCGNPTACPNNLTTLPSTCQCIRINDGGPHLCAPLDLKPGVLHCEAGSPFRNLTCIDCAE